MQLHSAHYRQAFIAYLRRGIPINLALKEETRPTTHYIWRTRGDGKVRPSHATNDGKIFSRNAPPETGHPGEDYGCRCWAEPLNGDFFVTQNTISLVQDNSYKWGNRDFWNHYTARSGQMITLQEAGYLQEVIKYFASEVITSDESKGGYLAVERQIVEKAKRLGEGTINYDFGTSYEFGNFWDILLDNGFFSLGDSTVNGAFRGKVRKETSEGREYLVISGIMTYSFSDRFEDPFDLIERTQFLQRISREEAEQIVGDEADKYGEPYDIMDHWQTQINVGLRIK